MSLSDDFIGHNETVQAKPSDPEQEPTVSLVIGAAPQVNFACQQNAVPVIREIEIINHTSETYLKLNLKMHASPAFLSPKVWHILSPFGLTLLAPSHTLIARSATNCMEKSKVKGCVKRY